MLRSGRGWAGGQAGLGWAGVDWARLGAGLALGLCLGQAEAGLKSTATIPKPNWLGKGMAWIELGFRAGLAGEGAGVWLAWLGLVVAQIELGGGWLGLAWLGWKWEGAGLAGEGAGLARTGVWLAWQGKGLASPLLGSDRLSQKRQLGQGGSWGAKGANQYDLLANAGFDFENTLNEIPNLNSTRDPPEMLNY
ncbi:hypothetical protein BY996DRAFT_6506989 [Phakopsora pachyrhizi]|nr:hypothetical protein BY996DRAFT_6506989 [Phakopsora pachyrhizi]